ncbi:hypothetical protein [Leptospira noguchii]|uniref:hypothetical protein n=1 Tax=Leptospira noguchii TaxID=28182 RepID=UPI000774CCFD|nr:hypothetical protein [Leptospira noguchii]
MTNEKNQKRILKILYFAISVSVILLGLLIVFDDRLGVVGEPFIDHLMVMNIAISRQLYGVEGYAGLEQILTALKQIPNVSTIDLVTIDDYTKYLSEINAALFKTSYLKIINFDHLHGYINEQAYVYFVVLSFQLFGIKTQSISLFWFLIFGFSSFIFLVSYRNKISQLILLWCLVNSIIFIVICNPAVGAQLLSIYNYRFIPILGIIPFFHMLLASRQTKITFSQWFLIFLQTAPLLFVFLARGSSLWMLIALFISSTIILCIYLWRFRGWSLSKRIFSYRIFKVIFVYFRIPLLVSLLFFLVKYVPHQELHKEYSKEIWTQTHVLWHPLFIGVVSDPKLRSDFVCSKTSLSDKLKGFYHIPECDSEISFYKRFVQGIRNEPADMNGFHAAVKYLKENGSTDQIGTDIVKEGHFNIKWQFYDTTLRNVYFDLLRKRPIDVGYMYLFIKPIRFFMNVLSYVQFFIKSIYQSPNILFIILTVFSLHLFILVKLFHLSILLERKVESELRIFAKMILLSFIVSMIPSILFYSQRHTVADSATVLVALCIFLSIFLIKKSLKKRIPIGTY